MDFSRVRTEGKIFQGNTLSLAVLKRGDSGASDFAYIVSLKVSKRAVVRNRIRRILREAVRLHEGAREARGYDCVFLTKPGIVKMKSEELVKEANALLNKL